ncbi:MAG: hypothetical protein HFJ89_02935 [Oscillospiraceae bacterium]|nr:hypothetical protein [Oscillospiraceae bacterium]
MTRKVNIEKLSVWVLEFTAYSFIGWIYETILTSAVRGHFADTAVPYTASAQWHWC